MKKQFWILLMQALAFVVSSALPTCQEGPVETDPSLFVPGAPGRLFNVWEP